MARGVITVNFESVHLNYFIINHSVCSVWNLIIFTSNDLDICKQLLHFSITCRVIGVLVSRKNHRWWH